MNSNNTKKVLDIISVMIKNTINDKIDWNNNCETVLFWEKNSNVVTIQHIKDNNRYILTLKSDKYPYADIFVIDSKDDIDRRAINEIENLYHVADNYISSRKENSINKVIDGWIEELNGMMGE